jgi:hypothetical protein
MLLGSRRRGDFDGDGGDGRGEPAPCLFVARRDIHWRIDENPFTTCFGCDPDVRLRRSKLFHFVRRMAPRQRLMRVASTLRAFIIGTDEDEGARGPTKSSSRLLVLE